MSGAAIAAEVALAYAEAGRDAGDGLGAVSVTITRPGQPTGPEWAPVPGAPVNHTFTAKPSAKAYTQRTGLALGAGELVYSLVNYGVTIAPSTSDALTIDGVNWPVQEVIPMDPAGYVISWMVKVAGPGSAVASLFALFVPQGSDALITSDGDTFKVRA
jgi:hypothetical protein